MRKNRHRERLRTETDKISFEGEREKQLGQEAHKKEKIRITSTWIPTISYCSLSNIFPNGWLVESIIEKTKTRRF